MKICGVKTYVVANPPPHHGGPYFVFLKLTTDANLHGFGEVYGAPFAPDKVVSLIEDVVDQHGARPWASRSTTCWAARCTSSSARTPTYTRHSPGRPTRWRLPTSLVTRTSRHKGRQPM